MKLNTRKDILKGEYRNNLDQDLDSDISPVTRGCYLWKVGCERVLLVVSEGSLDFGYLEKFQVITKNIRVLYLISNCF